MFAPSLRSGSHRPAEKPVRLRAALSAVGAALALLFPWATPAWAQPELAVNIEEGHSDPVRTVRLGDMLYTAARADGGGYRVYRVDLVTGVGEPEPALPTLERVPSLEALDSQIICQGTPVGGTRKVWAFDGSVATVIYEPAVDIYATNFFEMDDLILFSCNGGGNGYEPWTSDGTLAGTSQLLEINPADGSNPAYEVAWNGEVYFRADDGSTGVELWKTDGTVGGTVLVRDIVFGATSSTPLYITVFEGQLIFSANDDLYRSDGTGPGTTLVSGIGTETGFVVAPNWAYYGGDDPATGAELYRTDGTVVELVADIVPGPEGSEPKQLTAVGNQIYFTVAGLDNQLWISDGSSAGTTLVADLNSTNSEDYTIGRLTEHDGALYFTASDPGGLFESELWRSDGDGAAPVKLELLPGDLGARPSDLTSGIDDLYFSAFDGTDTGRELWRVSNGSGAPEVAYDILPSRGSDPTRLLVGDSDLYFFAESYESGRTCFSADLDDPTLDPFWVADPFPAISGTDVVRPESELAVDGGNIFLTMETSDAGFEPAEAGSGSFYPLDVRPGPDGSDPSDLTIADGNLYFVAEVHTTGGYGVFLYEPGLEAGTGDLSLLRDFGPERPTDLLENGGGVLFVASTPDFGTELWRATPDQIGLVVDIHPGTEGSLPTELTPMGPHVFFAATGPSTGRELWCTDGSAAGTQIVADLNGGATSSDPESLTDGYPFLYFSANVAADGRELYKATSAGASPLEEIVTGPGSGEPNELAFASSRLYFSADDGSGVGREPWVSNGETVQLAVDLNPGSGSSNPSDFLDHLGAVYFLANDGASGRELWRGSSSSYINVSDPIAPGSSSALVGEKVGVSDSRLIFVAEDAEFGRELWFVSDAGGPADAPIVPIRLGDSLSLRAGPNPFGDRLEIRYELREPADVSVCLIDAGGRTVAEEKTQRQEAGPHTLRWAPAELTNLPGGMFFLQLRADGRTAVRKVLRVK